jgi:ribosomal protein S18 acetylase RimI-like enzyme
MNNFEIVKLTPDEWQLYKQHRLEALLVEPRAFGSCYAEVLQRADSYWQERLIEAQSGKKSWLLFAKENTQIIGMIGAFRVEESDVVEIVSVYVTKEKRRLGVANALMAAILNEVGKGKAIRKVVIGVNAGQTAAVSLYQHFGFQIVEEKIGVMGDGISYPSYIMEKELIVP